ncbi:hypothetical protein [Microbacterium candidum]|uniref:Uncharacterized protein n=1 Tax=Microbacterium candidum TaxID=3041922 RepID=A0ABT7N087_9MICO|nr:hypothetical protein [Microbacterium sp. ASV49]MDL9980071.1 hypothetical protein [Microbacterium sp. ASV49]
MITTDVLPTGSRARRLRVLVGILELADGKVNEFVETERVVEGIGAELELSRDDLVNEFELLDHEGLVTAHRTLGGLNHVLVRPEGKSAAESFDQARRDVVVRRRHLQDDYLRWLYEEIEVHGHGPTPDDFLRGGAHFHGVAYTSDELMKAGARLKEGAYIGGQEAWQYSAPLRPQLTAKGRHTVEQGRSVHDPVLPAPTQHFETHVQGPANVSIASSHVTQTLVVTDPAWGDKVSAVLDAVTQAIGALTVDESTQVAQLVDEARQGVSVQEPTRTKQALIALGGFLKDVSSGALGGILSTQVLALVALFS